MSGLNGLSGLSKNLPVPYIYRQFLRGYGGSPPIAKGFSAKICDAQAWATRTLQCPSVDTVSEKRELIHR